MLTIQDTSYAGEVLQMFIAMAATSFDTLQKGCCAVLPGIKKKQTIPTISVDSFIQARKATPNKGGNAKVGARVLEPQDFMGYLEFNPRDFEQHWAAVEMNPKLLDAELPVTAESAITQEVIKLNKSYMDFAFWQSIKDDAAIAAALTNGLGPTDNNLIFFNGMMNKLQVSTKTIKIATPVALTKANIFDKMTLVKEARPAAIKNQTSGKYLVSYTTAEIFEGAQQGQNFKGANYTDAGKMTFGGLPVVALSGVPDNTIVYCVATSGLDSMLWLGVNEIDEEEYLLMNRLQNNSELWFLKMLFKIDVNYAFAEQIVVYTTEDFS